MRRSVFPPRPLLLAALAALIATPARATPESEATLARAITLETSLAKPADEVRTRLELAGALTRLEARAAALKVLAPLEARGVKSSELTAALAAAKAIGPDPDRLDGALAESAAALIAGDTKKAAGQFRLAEWFLVKDEGEEWSGPWRLYEGRGDRLAQADRFDLAKADLAKATGRDGKPTPVARIFLGRILLAEGDTPGALAQFDAIGPDTEFAYHLEARTLAARTHVALYEKNKDIEGLKTALEIYSGLLARDPGLEQLRDPRRELFIRLPESERDRVPVDADLEFLRALAYSDKGDKAEARRRLEFLLIRHPRKTEAWRLHAELTTDPERRKLDTAVADQLEATSPRDTARFPKELCAPAFHEAVHRRPFDTAPYLARAKTVWEKAKTPGEASPAERDIRFAKQLDPYDPEVFVYAAAYAARRDRLENFSERGRWKDEGFVAADRAVALAPEDPGILLWRAKFSADNDTSRGQKDAICFCTRALRVDPASTPVRLQRARYEVMESRKTEAEADYRKILADEPRHAEAKQELADLLSGKSDIETIDATSRPTPKRK